MGFISRTIGAITGANDQADAAQQAASTQAASAQAGIDEQRRQFAALQQGLSPYTNAGASALTGQQNLLGLNGYDAQASAINGIQGGAQYQAIQGAGNNALLQNASATGGLRGGNTQGALAQFNQSLLAQQIQQQYANLGGLTSLGQNSAAGVGNAGMQTGNNIANLLQQKGSATAGGQIAAGNTTANTFGSLLGLGGTLAGSGAFSGLGNLFGGSSGGSLLNAGTPSSIANYMPSTTIENSPIPFLSKF